jgi:hypothetical protein
MSNPDQIESFLANYDQNQQIIIKKFISKFDRIKQKPIDAINRGPHAVGDTFEHELGLKMSPKKTPDFERLIEIKSRASKSALTLFTKYLDDPKTAHDDIRENYGEKNDTQTKKRFYASISMGTENKWNKVYKGKVLMRLEKVDFDEKKIFLTIKDDPQKFYFSFNKIEEILHRKLQLIAIVNAKKIEKNNELLFQYFECFLVGGWNIEKFVELVNNRKMQYDFKTGNNQSGKGIKDEHDHGPGFRLYNSMIKENKLKEIFQYVVKLD